MKKVISSIISAYLLTGVLLAGYFFALPKGFPWYLAADAGKYSDWLNILLKIFQPMFLWGPAVISDFTKAAGKLPSILDSGLTLLFIILAMFFLFRVNKKGRKAIKAVEEEQ